MMYQKTTVEIDVEELGRARAVLGTSGTKETINAALRAVNRRAALQRAADHVRTGRFRAPDEAAWAAWREPRA